MTYFLINYFCVIGLTLSRLGERDFPKDCFTALCPICIGQRGIALLIKQI